MNKNITEIIFLLDRSGSMSGLEKETIRGFNAFVEKQIQLEGNTLVTTVLFDDEYEILWSGLEASEVRLTDKEYYVRGCTALLDAVGETILDVRNRISITTEDQRPRKVQFVITTDGLENSSVEFNYEKVKNLISHQKEVYNWEFLFLGANIDVSEEADKMGIESNNVYQYEASPTGVAEMYDMAYEALEEKRRP